ncbi:MAG: DUF362 domain-containing protein [candidate division Zixibacteria bacterium]|nr:DUF362 domain-containing protein [candidate division Zixibacteria bacterium]
MPSKVYFINARVEKFDYKYSLLGRLEKVLKDIDLSKYFSGEELVPIKMHLGNKGAHSTIRPNFVKLVIDKMKEVGAKPFVTDSARVKPYEYLEVANEMGYNSLTLGVPIIIADGIFGFDSIKVKAGEMLKEINVPTAIYDASAMMVLTHVKGHIDSSLGGAIKNLAMGCVSALPRSCHWKEGGRGKMHFLMWDIMEWDKKLCTFCGICVNNCPMDAITIKAKVFEVDDKKCVRCGRCVKVCPERALKIPFSAENFQKGMAESVKAVLSTFKPGKVLYINFILDVQPECDCMLVTDTPVIQDQGILVSDDIVAIDQATMDIIQKAAPLPQSKAEGIELGKFEDILSAIHQKDAKIQIKAAEKLGLGSRKYKLIEF